MDDLQGLSLFGRLGGLEGQHAALLQKAGVKIAFQTGSFTNLGDIAAEARMAAAAGLPYKEALKVLTMNAAEILGRETT